MALPSGTFNDAASGALEISFSGVWKTYRVDAGYDITPVPGTGYYLWVRCVVTYSGGSRSALLGFENNSAKIDIDYVGGTDVYVAMDYAGHSFGSGSGHPNGVYVEDTVIKCVLIKR